MYCTVYLLCTVHCTVYLCTVHCTVHIPMHCALYCVPMEGLSGCWDGGVFGPVLLWCASFLSESVPGFVALILLTIFKKLYFCLFRLNDAHWSVVTSDFTMTHKNYNSFNIQGNSKGMLVASYICFTYMGSKNWKDKPAFQICDQSWLMSESLWYWEMVQSSQLVLILQPGLSLFKPFILFRAGHATTFSFATTATRQCNEC